MKKTLFIVMLCALCGFTTPQHLKPFYHHAVGIDEPSDICAATEPDHYYVVGDRGSVCEIDGKGMIVEDVNPQTGKKIQRATNNNGSDYEGVCVKDGIIYLMDESMRRIDVISEADWKAAFTTGKGHKFPHITKSLYLHYSGPRNKGFEGITYIPERKKFVAVIERPTMVFELNEDLQTTAELRTSQFYELSSVRYHDGFLWFLSDENHEIMKCDINDYHIIDRWKIPVDNPEGIAFDNDGNVLITSDDMAELFKFKMQ